MKTLRISAVSYLNTLPFVYGIKNAGILNDYELVLDTPADCALKLAQDEADVGLLPVGALPELEHYKIIGDYCIGCKGAVGSVILYSDVLLNDIEQIYLDYQSKTSVLLTQILAKKHWHINPKWEAGSKDYELKIGGSVAGLVIGDRTFEMDGKYNYQFDLGEAWLEYSGLPFVFACWVANKELPLDVIEKFSSTIKFGIENKAMAIKEIFPTNNYNIDIHYYLNNSISYELDEEKREGMQLFLDEIVNLTACKAELQ